MKMNKSLSLLTVAVATIAAAWTGRAAAPSGNVWEIRAMDQVGVMVFGQGHAEPNPYLCSPERPLSAGDVLTLRMRLFVNNWDVVQANPTSDDPLHQPKVWFFKQVTGSVIDMPYLGLLIGDKRQDRAEYVTAWYDSDAGITRESAVPLEYLEDGTPSKRYRYYVDFYFQYTVKAGDLGMPVRLMGQGGGPASESSGFLLGNVGTDPVSSKWMLVNADGETAKLVMPENTDLASPEPFDWPSPTMPASDRLKKRNMSFDLWSEGIYMKTLDFDMVNSAGKPWSEGDVWREVFPGGMDAEQPSPTVALLNDKVATEDIDVYVWSGDEKIVQLDGATQPVEDENGNTRQVMKVTIKKGLNASTPFRLKGAPEATTGMWTNIFMSASMSTVKTPTGLETIAVSRKVTVGVKQDPKVRPYLDDKTTVTTQARRRKDPDAQALVAQLKVKVENALSDQPVKFVLKATVNGGETLHALYEANVLRITESEGFDLNGKAGDNDAELEIPAGAAWKTLYVYVVGATADTEKYGIRFEVELKNPPAGITSTGSCTLTVRRPGEDGALFTSCNPLDGSTVTIGKNESKTFKYQIDDTFANLENTTVGYRFHVMYDLETGDEWVTAGFLSKGWYNFTLNPSEMNDASGNLIFPVSENPYPVMIWAESPDGLTTTKAVQNYIKVNDDTKKVLVEPADHLTYAVGESDFVPFKMALSLNTPHDGSMIRYIYLKGATDDDTRLVNTNMPPFSKGLEIDKGNLEVMMPADVYFVDGVQDHPKVSLTATLANQADEPWSHETGNKWGSGTVGITVTNCPPTLGSLEIAGTYRTADESGQALAEAISSGVPKEFKLVTVTDVKADLDTVEARWLIDGKEYVTNWTNTVIHTFASVKDAAVIQVFLKDKDMASFPKDPNFRCTVPVKAKPNITITAGGTDNALSETAAGTAQGVLTVKLSEMPQEKVEVELKVKHPASGCVKLHESEGAVSKAGLSDDGKYDLYTLTFDGVDEQLILIDELDGANSDTWALDVTASVKTEKWKDYYQSGRLVPALRILNMDPDVIRPNESEVAFTNENASANTPYPIFYAAQDVVADLATGIVVTITVDGKPSLTTNVTDTTVRSHDVQFDGPGFHFVDVTFTDKDQGASHRTINFFVQQSKVLELRAHGPAVKVGGGYSAKYQSAPGLGAGRVYAGESGPQKVESFVHTYSFGLLTPSVNAYAYGYKADDKADDGTLQPGKDQELDVNGSWTRGKTIETHYNYTQDNTTPDSKHKGFQGLDSFVYGWACNNSVSSKSSEGGGEDFVLDVGETGSYPIPLPDAENGGGSGDAKNKAVPIQYWEALFSAELLKSDNCGDMNGDGIPDKYVAHRYYFDVVDKEGKLVGDDIRDLNFVSAESTEPYCAEGDYLPSIGRSEYSSLIPGLPEDWVKLGNAFTPILKIRGFPDAYLLTDGNETPSALNNAPALAGLEEIQPERIYTNPKTDENSTLSYVEWLAWREFAAGKYPNEDTPWTNQAHFVEWTPENPTDPTKADSDRDGMTDGYEYWIWYQAHVGWIENFGTSLERHRRLTGRAYDPANPGEGKFIDSDEIAKAFNPNSGAGSLLRDFDNDGLPDIIEFLIGTKPYDFDSDNDGLPDGWEIVVSGTDPLRMYTSDDTIADTVRNYDGDAMAFASVEREAEVLPRPLFVQRYNTFATVDPNGDTDGVQWYAETPLDEGKSAMTYELVISNETGSAALAGTHFTADGVDYITTGAFARTEAGRLAATLAPDCTFVATNLADGVEVLGGLEAPEGCEWLRLMPVRLEAGVAVSAPDKDVGYACAVVKSVGKGAVCNAAWPYGRSVFGGNAETAYATFVEGKDHLRWGMLAMARYAQPAAGAPLAALPTLKRDVAFLHYLVYQQFGFDPRTAWNPNTPLAARWGKAADGQAYADQNGEGKGYAGQSTRTREFTAYDEFLLLTFWLNNSAITLADVTADPTVYPWSKIWRKFTTDPRGPNEPIWAAPSDFEGDSASAEGIGADTDGDGVPDGWELYVMAGPKMVKEDPLTGTSTKEFVFAPPYAGFLSGGKEVEPFIESSFSPFIKAASESVTDNEKKIGKMQNDGLTELEEFAGTDSCAYYSEVQNGNAVAYSTTIVRPEGQAKWLNKFFPTDPWSKDTDDDGITDGDEGAAFVYAETVPEDDKTSISFAGCGLNPCSVDTDQDGLPDGWEKQFTLPPGEAVVSTNVVEGLLNCMDGTVFDAWTKTDGPNRDYDHDGLENWQEYMTGVMRCWRYDDPYTQWGSIPYEMYFSNNQFNPQFKALGVKGETMQAKLNDFWYQTLVDKKSPIYNPHLLFEQSPSAQFLSRVDKGWDPNYIDSVLDTKEMSDGRYYWFAHRIGGEPYLTAWPENGYADDTAPVMYASCSPVNSDTDQDGMDDYYELFHGLNPLLGSEDFGPKGPAPCDVVGFLATDLKESSVRSLDNWWTANPPGVPRGNSPQLDFTVFPWRNGLQTVDADGDNERNYVEAIMAYLEKDAWMHTDPTPMWMTDSSYSNSLTRLHYRIPNRSKSYVVPIFDDKAHSWCGKVKDANGEDVPGFTHEFVKKDAKGNVTTNVVKYFFRDFDGIDVKAFFDKTAPKTQFTAFVPDRWLVGRKTVNPRNRQRRGDGEDVGNWMFSFEENEGYDTDHDGVNDAAEIAGQTGSSTDPLDADSPRRRQAMYFPGRDSALQTPPVEAESHPVSGTMYERGMVYLKYTVECWVKPDADGETVPDSIIVERTIWCDPATAGDQELIRKNFQLAVRNGKWFTKFDSNGTDKYGETGKFSSEMARPGVWTHLAATYDGQELVLYVNGLPTGDTSDATLAKQQPENGSSSFVFSAGREGSGQMNVTYNNYAYAIIVGAGLKTYADFPDVAFADKEVGYALNVYNGRGWENYKGFFKGYVDEVRIWDGARTAKEIAGSMKVRYDADLAQANRAAFYEEWRNGRRRGESGVTDLMAELRYHFSFDSLFAAENEKALSVVPVGFASGDRAPLVRPEGYELPWWKTVLAGYGSAYAGATNYVTWIPNTVARLPRFDGTTIDSAYFSEDIAGGESGEFKFANSADPYPMWTQYVCHDREVGDYETTSTRHHLVNGEKYQGTGFSSLFGFSGRLRETAGSELLPLGGAYARYVVDMWDGQGPGSMNELSGGDADADGLPDWWEKYADENYRGDLDPAVKIDWNTKVFYNGRMMTAGEAYLRDLARGAYANSALEYALDAKYEQVADVNGSGMPDWWTSLYGIAGESGLDDHDRDGLPNEVEYLLSECFDFKVLFNPSKACSVDEYTPDYFFRVGELYAGEIFTDHDLVDDAWEDLYDDKFASRLVWDAYEDFDKDGWSNRSEYRYARQSLPTQADQQTHYSAADGLVADYPIPTISLTLKYGEARKTDVASAPIIVKMTTAEKLTGDFDATFEIAGVAKTDAQAGSGTSSSKKDEQTKSALTRTLGKWSNRHALGTLTPGYINKDSVALQFCFDPDALIYTWQVDNQISLVTKRGSRTEYDADRIKYGEANVELLSRDTSYRELANVQLRTTANSSVAKWILTKTGLEFGTLDLTTGAFDINLGAFAGYYVVNSSNENDRAAMEDQTYRIAYAVNAPVDLPRKLYLGEATSGHVREGKNKIVAWADLDGDGAYTPGEPFGCAVGVDVSWKGTSAEIELTETSVVSPRMNIATGESDREVVWGSESGYWTNLVVGALNGGTKTRVRVIRTIYNSDLVTGLKALGIADSVSQRVVLDKYVDLNSWPVITEADFLSESIHDIDWLTLSSDILSPLGGKLKDLGRMYYRVVLGEGTIDLAVENNLFNVMFSRAFDSADARVKPTDLRPGPQGGQEVLAATPTFKWSMGAFNTYTAFRVQVKNAAGTVVYDSGYQRAPQNADGNYEWTPSLLRAGDKTTSGLVFADQAQYTWQVSMYNSKFTGDSWATEGRFFLNANGSGARGAAQVAVRYFGPKLSYANKTIRVKAFASPDFTGSPVASGYVAAPDDAETGVAVTGKVVKANCQVIGIPKGTYYLQAFIDSNGNGVCDKWESMGYLCDRIGKDVDNFDPVAMTFADARGEGDLATIYIEDADTDGDSLPDAWEYAKKGNLTALGVGDAELTALGGRLVAKELEAAVLKAAGDNPVASGLAGRILTTMNSSRMFMALASGVAPEALDPDAEIAITGLQFNAAENAVEIAFSGSVTSAGEGIRNALYTYRPGDSLKFQVYRTETLAGEWKPVGEVKTVPVSAGNVGDTLKVGMEGLNVKGGFFKVVVLP